MKLILDNNQLDQAPANLLRQAGYAYLIDRNTGQESFIRGLGRGYYPRFHLYLVEQNGQVIFNLHLDQKQASYAGVHAHNAEYDGETVAMEMARIKEQVTRNSQSVTQNEKAEINQNILDQIRPKQFNAVRQRVEKKSWWKKFFR